MPHSALSPRIRVAAWLGSTALVLAVAIPANAETLQGALAKAYENNPTLTAARAGQRANDENVPIQKSAGLPSASAQMGYEQRVIRDGTAALLPDQSGFIAGRLSVPIYQGGGVRNAVNAAKARVEAGQADLRGTEASIFSQVVGAYMDVLRDQAIVALNRNQVEVLDTNLRATRDRFEIGDLTRTDVAQSEARLALAQGQLRGAEANLIASRESYVRLVGDAPVDLVQPPQLPNLPAGHEEAVAIALNANPDLEAAKYDIDAARYSVRAAQASRLPQLSATVDSNYSPGFDTARFSTIASAGLAVTIPLFQGGRPSAQVRQAQARNAQAIETYVAVERGVIAQTRGAFASWQASQQVIAATRQAVSANALSLEGVRAENSVGTRSILDILNAEQELLNTQVQLVSAERNAYVAAFTLLAAMGKAEARDLGLEGGALYDPEANYQRVKGEIWDWADDPAPKQVATDTRAVPAANAAAPDIARPGSGQ
jgi:outer membrane protein